MDYMHEGDLLTGIVPFKLMPGLYGFDSQKIRKKSFSCSITPWLLAVLFLNLHISIADVNVGLIGRLHGSHARISRTVL